MKASDFLRRCGTLVLSLCLISVSAYGQAKSADAPGPENEGGSTLLPIRKIAEVPAVDGVLEEEIDRAACWSSPFVVLGKENAQINGLWEGADEKFIRHAAKAAVFSDGKQLYAVFKAPFPADTPPGEKDSVEFFLQEKAGGRTWQMLVDTAGNALFFSYEDDNAEPVPWTGHNAKTAVKVNKDHFVVEMSVPLAALGMDSLPADGTAWRGNFCRSGVSCGGHSSWMPTGQRYFVPSLFGLLLNGTEKDYFEKEIRTIAEQYPDLPVIRDRAEELQETVRDIETFRASDVEKLTQALALLRRQAVKLQNEGKTTFIWKGNPWSDFGPDVTITDKEELRSISLRAPRGARAIGAFLVSNLTNRHNMFTMKVRARKDLLSRIRFREGGFVQDRKRVFPDAIFDLPLGEVVRQAPESTSLIWMDVDTAGLAPGVYRGKIDFVPAYPGFQARQLSFELRVSEVDLAEVSIMLWTYQMRHTRAFELLKDYGFNTSNLVAKWFAPDPDENGNYNFDRLDQEIEAIERSGIPRGEIRLIANLFLPFWSEIRLPDGRKVSFGDPGWKEEYGKRLLLFRDHLKEKYGMDYSRYCFSLSDEPQGDPKTPGTRAWIVFEGAKFLKSVDPNFRTYENPCRFGTETDALYPENFDVLVPYLPRLEQCESAMKLYERCDKKVYTYSIHEKPTSPLVYRRLAWKHMYHGFRGTPFFYNLFHFSGDQFMSGDADTPDSKRTNDFGTVYINSLYKAFGFHQKPEAIKIAVSRRMESWYQGIIDFKVSEFCRNKISERKARGEDTSAFEKEFADLAALGASASGDMEEAGNRLLDLAEKLLKGKE